MAEIFIHHDRPTRPAMTPMVDQTEGSLEGLKLRKNVPKSTILPPLQKGQIIYFKYFNRLSGQLENRRCEAVKQ
jgi:hypothetical protein